MSLYVIFVILVTIIFSRAYIIRNIKRVLGTGS
jgi:hypothetical protein